MGTAIGTIRSKPQSRRRSEDKRRRRRTRKSSQSRILRCSLPWYRAESCEAKWQESEALEWQPGLGVRRHTRHVVNHAARPAACRGLTTGTELHRNGANWEPRAVPVPALQPLITRRNRLMGKPLGD
jgi:hypothetical protein